jgi:hypothetical protein
MSGTMSAPMIHALQTMRGPKAGTGIASPGGFFMPACASGRGAEPRPRRGSKSRATETPGKEIVQNVSKSNLIKRRESLMFRTHVRCNAL